MHTRARTLVPRATVALIMLLMSVVPAGATEHSPDITFTTVSSPTQITAGMPVAYPVTVTNSSKRTINHITVSGAVAPGGFTFLYATPTESCSGSVCSFAQLPSGAPLPEITFYYKAPADQLGLYRFTVTAIVGEGGNDNSQAAHQDTFPARPVETTVIAPDPDFVAGHAVLAGPPEHRRSTFTTGMDVHGGNPHGTSVTVPTNAKVTIRDIPPTDAGLESCAAWTGGKECFGWGSSLDVGKDLASGMPEFFPAGFEVVMRWDDSQLRGTGITPRKLRVIHFWEGTPELVTELCVPGANDVPTNMPCFNGMPYKDGNDLVAPMIWDHNGVGRGW